MNQKLEELRRRRGVIPFRAPTVVGIDPGFSGGLAAVSFDGRVVDFTAMPAIKAKKSEVDVDAIAEFLRRIHQRLDLRLVVIELVGPRPTDGTRQAFNFGVNYGEVRGVVKVLGLPIELVSPQKWMKAIFGAGVKVVKGQPKPSIAYVRRRFPSVNLRRTERCTTDHDGIADAIVIAEWGCRQLRTK